MPQLITFFLLLTLSGCADLSYYGQLIYGHGTLLLHREKISALLDTPETPETLRRQLETIVEIREFSVRQLHLPDNNSYRTYVRLERPYPVWVVTAAPEFSIQPRTWCFPIAGCVSYRGYYRQEAAEAYAQSLQKENYDTSVRGAPAYSTLNWFADPVLSSFSSWRPAYLAGLIFHELAHQLVYCKDDSSFNEGFAEAVEEIGVRRWLEARGMHEELIYWGKRRAAWQDFSILLLDLRDELAQLYTHPIPANAMRLKKKELIAGFQLRYENARKEWEGIHFDSWLAKGINNARLASVSTYNSRKALFLYLYREECAADLDCFYRVSRNLAALPHPQREQQMETYR